MVLKYERDSNSQWVLSCSSNLAHVPGAHSHKSITYTPKKGLQKGLRRCWEVAEWEGAKQLLNQLAAFSYKHFLLPPVLFIEYTTIPLYLKRGLYSSLFCVHNSSVSLAKWLRPHCKIGSSSTLKLELPALRTRCVFLSTRRHSPRFHRGNFAPWFSSVIGSWLDESRFTTGQVLKNPCKV